MFFFSVWRVRAGPILVISMGKKRPEARCMYVAASSRALVVSVIVSGTCMYIHDMRLCFCCANGVAFLWSAARSHVQYVVMASRGDCLLCQEGAADLDGTHAHTYEESLVYQKMLHHMSS